MMRYNYCTFLLGLLLVLPTAYAFMCYTRELGSDSTSVEFCSTGTCYSVGGSVLGSKDSEKGCAVEAHEDGCVAAGIPGIASGHTCFCTSFLCNSARTPTTLLPLLVLPVLLQRIL